nr:MAG TPA: helix-turn-helix domain protein [Caudoviricetes sp.]
MWDEQKHPRNKEGEFTTKYGFEEYKKSWETNPLGLRLGEKKFNALVEKFENAGIPAKRIEELRTTEYSKDTTTEEYKKIFAEKDKENLEKREQELKSEKERINREKQDRETTERIANILGVSSVKANKLKEVYKAYKDLIQNNLRLEAQSRDGYSEHSKSTRALKAEREGKLPLTAAAKLLGVSSDKIKQNCYRSEWHHTGALYGATSFYDISPVLNIIEAAYERDEYKTLTEMAHDLKIKDDDINTFKNVYSIK